MEQFKVEPIVPLTLGGYDVSFTNQAAVMVGLVSLITLFMLLAVRNRVLVPGRMQSVAEVMYEFVQNIITSAAGEAGLRFFPFVFTLFTFVLFSNMLGLIPGVFTVTSQIAVTGALACLVILIVVIAGLAYHGLRFFSLFVPKAPWVLLILLVPIEVISFLTRPLSLSVRLFANMLAGHTILKVFAGFVVALGTAGGVLSIASVAPMAAIVGIYALEILVAFLQAYVFAVLTCIYLNEAIHLHDHH